MKLDRLVAQPQRRLAFARNQIGIADPQQTRIGGDPRAFGFADQAVQRGFTSLVVLTAEALPGAQELGRFLADRIEQRFRDVIDPDIGVTVHVEQSLHATAPVAVYLGHGVHAPPADNRLPHGEVVIRQDAQTAIGQPIIGVNTPGGLYSGQARFAFSRSEMLTPAVHPDLPGGTIFFLGRYPVDASARDAGGLPLLTALPQTPEARAQAIQIETLALPGGNVDARFEILGVRPQVGRVSLGLVDVTLDRRPCRLQAQPPRGPHLAVLGLAEPALRDMPPVSELASGYVRLFGHSLRGRVCPYEIEYGKREPILQAQALSDVGGFYRAFGLVPSGKHGERWDHVAIELPASSLGGGDGARVGAQRGGGVWSRVHGSCLVAGGQSGSRAKRRTAARRRSRLASALVLSHARPFSSARASGLQISKRSHSDCLGSPRDKPTVARSRES